MSGNQIKKFDIMILKVEFDDGTGYKPRPALALRINGETIFYYKITSQFANKSRYIQERYFEIVDYVQAGLRKRSYIDTITVRKMNETQTKFEVIGRLSNRDILALIEFLKSFNK